ncbi:uncharacterized protein N0V89_011383 [Didymosphaeria variabile]|uniref:Peptidase S33 tripeptidyl aminopeptidase-like C-terminal domain-containing protein n=1 Tax=Didymosphaeria variabile TaxID=1932322 RepID=A0A9W8XB65_9PLEO|nr:uncharacterized protein N0V89_011383 [Didymosphaeria variabile]KAJ4345253.1 hypothetical protein N0V89_011383 [Didymosphaeria variabile]
MIAKALDESGTTFKSILQHCSGRRANSDVFGPQWEDFNWDAIHATEELKFHPCWNDFQCAKLKVPLDWFNGTHPNASASIAIAKLPAQVPVDDPRYAGPVLINPGGPGGSGVLLALLQAHELRTIMGPSGSDASVQSKGKHYDILGFDPRGIGFTAPLAQCMPDNPSSWSWKLRERAEGILGSSDAALGRLWSMSHAWGSSCKQHSDASGEPDIKQYISTASVARDMLEIAERHAKWAVDKSNELARVGLSTTGRGSNDQTIYKRGEVKLTYAGFSYGTYLGATFAGMFPDRVGRLMLDGVVNVHDYNNGLAQGSLHDTEKDMKSFYTFCATAGPELCPLAASTASVEDIEQRTQRIIKSLYHNPIGIDTAQGPEIFTYSDLKGIIFSGLYQPNLVFPGLAHILLAVEEKTGEVLDAIGNALRGSHIYTCPAINGSATFPLTYDTAQDAILCGDGVWQNDLDLKGMEEYYRLLESISPAAGGIWAMLKMKCAAWPIKPLYTFGRDDNFYGNTSHPILWISNTADPVTPLRSARAMSARFPGSEVLVQDSAGHCALSVPVACTVAAVKTYFQTGELPAPDTVCIPPTSPWSLNSTDPKSPFYDPSLGQAVFVAEDAMEGEMQAARGLQAWAVRHLGFGRSHLGQRVADMVDVAMAYSAGNKGLRDEL